MLCGSFYFRPSFWNVLVCGIMQNSISVNWSADHDPEELIGATNFQRNHELFRYSCLIQLQVTLAEDVTARRSQTGIFWIYRQLESF